MDFAVLAEAVPLRGRTVLDVGCGDGALVRRLAAAGADAIGVDVRVDRAYGGRFLVGGAEALPLPDASVDVAVLMRSLHHVPSPDAAFPELRRVVRDVVYIAEPLAEGEFFELMRPVDDETAVRASAQAAIGSAEGFERLRTFEYDSPIALDSFEAFERMVLGADPGRRARFASVEGQLRERFRPGGYESRTRVDLLRVVSSRP